MVKECEESVLKKLVKVCRWCIHTNMLSIEESCCETLKMHFCIEL